MILGKYRKKGYFPCYKEGCTCHTKIKGGVTNEQTCKRCRNVVRRGAPGFCAYKWMSPSDKQKISKDAKRTAEDMGDVKRDVARMANTIKETF